MKWQELFWGLGCLAVGGLLWPHEPFVAGIWVAAGALCLLEAKG